MRRPRCCKVARAWTMPGDLSQLLKRFSRPLRRAFARIRSSNGLPLFMAKEPQTSSYARLCVGRAWP
jgi:hypothetical protein